MKVNKLSSMIKETRKTLKITQEELAYSVDCSPKTISRLETGQTGISLPLLTSIMQRLDLNNNLIPSFHTVHEYNLQKKSQEILFLINSWHLSEADHQLKKFVKLIDFKDTEFLQMSLVYKGLIKIKSGLCDYRKVYLLLIKAIKTSIPSFKLKSLSKCVLIPIHVEILLALSECLIKLGYIKESQQILLHLEDHLGDAHISYIDNIIFKQKLFYQLSSIHLKFNNYKEVIKITKKGIKLCLNSSIYFTLYELTFNYIIGCYKQGYISNAMTLFKYYFYSVVSADLPIIEQLKSCAINDLNLKLDDKLLSINLTKKGNFVFPTYYLNDCEMHNQLRTYELGKIIKDHRKKHQIQQQKLAYGICSISTISKLENNNILVDYYLVDIILQRLGIYLKNLNIYVSDLDYDIIQLKKHLLYSIIEKNEISIKKLLNIYFKKINKNNNINMQIVFLGKAVMERDYTVKLRWLKKSLCCTLPEFQLLHINDYCLSINELTILNYIAETYYSLDKKLYAVHYALTIINYLNDSPYQLLEKQILLNMLIKNVSEWLNESNHIGDIKELNDYISLNYNPDTTLTFYKLINFLQIAMK